MTTWPRADVWLLLSLQYAAPGSLDGEVEHRLRYVISTADLMNHAVPTQEEMDDATRRLTAGGLIRVDSDLLALTRQGRDLLRANQGGSWHDEWARLEQALSDIPEPDVGSGQSFAPGAYECAVAEYNEFVESFLDDP
jgi:hypothetical protein